MGFIARVFGSIGGQPSSPVATLPAAIAPRRATSGRVLAASPMRAGSIFARFAHSPAARDLPIFRDRSGKNPSADVRQQAIERLAPRLQAVVSNSASLRTQLSQIEAQFGTGQTGHGDASAAATQTPLCSPTNALQAQQLGQQLERLGRFGKAIGELAELRLQLDAGLSGPTLGRSG